MDGWHGPWTGCVMLLTTAEHARTFASLKLVISVAELRLARALKECKC